MTATDDRSTEEGFSLDGIRSAPVPLALVDGETLSVRAASAPFRALLNGDLGSPEGRSVLDTFSEGLELADHLRSVSRTGEPARGVVAHRSGSGGALALTAWAQPAGDGGLDDVVVLATGPFQQLELADTLRAVNESLLLSALRERDRAKEARQESRAKSVFLASISHELRTPLNSIVGNSDLMLEGIPVELPEELRENVRRIRRAADHLVELIEQIISASRMEMETPELDDRIELTTFTNHVVGLVEDEARQAGLDLQVRVGPDVGAICSDRRRLTQILVNLLSNAIKFTESGWVRLEVDCVTEEAVVVFRVSDSGPGIAAGDQQRVFERFWQVDGTAVRTNQGLGIGLWVTRTLARALGGEIELTSEPGEGATFEVRLPADPEPPEPVENGEPIL